jgi:hypothetical protein
VFLKNFWDEYLYFQTLPQDGQKVRTLLGGTLYAYELPPPDDIKPLTLEEEKGLKGNLGLNDIQRGLATS